MILEKNRQNESMVLGVRAEVSLGREGNEGGVIMLYMLVLPTSRSLVMLCFSTWVAVTFFYPFYENSSNYTICAFPYVHYNLIQIILKMYMEFIAYSLIYLYFFQYEDISKYKK